MEYQFAGKRAIITGASSGIGAGIAKKFADLGVKTILTARRESLLKEVSEEITGSGGTGVVVPGDVTQRDDTAKVVEKALEQFGGIDIMVNCAGVGGPTYFEDTPEARVREHMEVHYFAAAEYCRQVIPIMKEQGSGYILNMASLSALLGFPRWVSYSASKAAILRFSDSLRHEVKKYGIKISVFCPSLVSTPLLHDHWDAYGPWAKKFDILEVGPVVDSLIGGMRKGKFIILDAPNVKLMYGLQRLFPRAFVRFFMWLYKVE